MLDLLEPALEPLLAVIFAIIAYYIQRLGHWLLVKTKATQAEKDAFDAVMAGVEYAYESFVRDAKKESDGKLTDLDRRRALEIAIEHAKTVATGPGKEFLRTVAKDRIGAWVKTIIARWK